MYTVPKGTKDVLPSESYKWHYIENAVRKTAELFSVKEIRTPVFEHTELFLRGVGGTTDIVNKEMYTFDDKGGRSITLKPEGTAGVARSVIENSLCAGTLPLKMYYISPIFRYEKPQAGRLREHHQFGVEIYGADTAECDVETILIAKTFFGALGLKNISVNINSIGCPDCRPLYNQALTRYYTAHEKELCGDCKDRLQRNPLRLLDCKNENCQKLQPPKITDYLCGACKQRFEEIKSLLTTLGVAFEVDTNIVRGLDYYTGIVFEFINKNIGAQSTVCGGGRYNKLTEDLGGAQIPAIGFGMGLERLLLTLDDAGLLNISDKTAKVYFAPIGKESVVKCLTIVKTLREKGVSAETDISGRSLKAQMKYADKISCGYAVVVGGDEISNDSYTVKNMKTHESFTTGESGILEFFANGDNN
ncbi:MAG: histidine--tRNA ligase [Clostridiales bacterium]|jgi:histidyl-tRNA synthetase|nr:histidine--tRNA ligase [Clostridiales bacterium]